MLKIVYFLMFCLLSALKAQQPYPLEFEKGDIVWKRLIANSNEFINSDALNKYSSVFPKNYLKKGDIIYGLYGTLKKNNQIDGLMLEKYNYKTNKLEWQNIINSATRHPDYEYYQDVFFRDDGNIEITGMRAKEIGKAYSPFVSKMIFNSDDGSLIDYKRDSLSSDNYEGFSRINIYPLIEDSLYFGAVPWGEVGPNPKQFLRVYLLNKDMLRIDSSRQDIKNDPFATDSFTNSHIPMPCVYTPINNHLLAIIYIYINEKEKKFEPRAELVIVDYSDANKFDVVKRTQFGENIEDYPDEKPYVQLKCEDNDIMYAFRYPKLNGTDLVRACSFMVFDTLGRLKINVKNIGGDSNYIHQLKIIGKLNNKYYVLGKKSYDRAAMDIFEIDENGNSKVLTTIITADRPRNDGFNGYESYELITEDNFFIFSGLLTTKINESGPASEFTTYTMAFDFKDLLSSIEETTNSNFIDVTIYPNPSNDFINIYIKNNISGKAEIFDMIGQKVFSFQIKSEENLMLPVYNLGRGEFIIKITDESGNLLASKIVHLN